MNFLGNETPQMLLCLHEESAIAIAHGYAKVTGKAMAAAVHSNVGLFHATMAIFNAWCDRMPIVVLGATGPVDAAKRRPWIDWIHTARDQGAIVRDYTKWDDQPASPAAAREALIRATWMANTAPMGPVYINLDAEMQEAKLAEPLAPIDVAALHAAGVARRVGRTDQGSSRAAQGGEASGDAGRTRVPQRRRLERPRRARRSDQRQGDHRSQDRLRFPDRSSAARRRAGVECAGAGSHRGVEGADLILGLDCVDLNGILRGGFGFEVPKTKIIHVSADFHVHHGWSMDYEALPPVDLLLPTTPDEAVPLLLAALGGAKAKQACRGEAEGREVSAVRRPAAGR